MSHKKKSLNFQEEIKESIIKVLPDLEVVLGWTSGFDPLHGSPLFMYGKEDVESLQVGPLSVHNLATYLPGLRGKKVGIVVKGCDSRSVIELLQESLINREEITLFAFSCGGVVDYTKISKHIGNTTHILACDITDQELVIETDEKSHNLQLSEVLADKCKDCRYPDALISDYFFGEQSEISVSPPVVNDIFESFAALSVSERFGFWIQEMDRCIRCYACRSACPLCVCRDHCAAESRDPHWLSQEDHVRDKLMFQVMHAYHMAGRCTECGECQRACPVDIPILLFKQKMNKEVFDIFGYEAGIDEKAVSPLLSFAMEEENIEEKKW